MGDSQIKRIFRLLEKLIWTYWHQGFDKAPILIQKCVQQVRKLHPEYTIHLLDESSVYEYADEVPISKEKWNAMLLPHRSDLLRTQLLIKYGGIWMDPTVFVARPFESWLPNYLTSGIFFFRDPGPDRPIANWFIAADKDNYVLKRLYQSLTEYWNGSEFTNLGSDNKRANLLKRVINGRSKPLSQLWLTPIVKNGLRVFPYMIYHFMFYKLLKEDRVFRSAWEMTPIYEAKNCIKVKDSGFDTIFSSQGFNNLCNENIPLFKLDWKLEIEHLPKETLIRRLLNF